MLLGNLLFVVVSTVFLSLYIQEQDEIQETNRKDDNLKENWCG